MRNRILLILAFLVLLNIAIWSLALYCFHDCPKLLALSILAYGFGLRHAVDADHIVAIDNVTRKFMHENKSPLGVGFYFSLGHSSVVILLSFLIALGVLFIRGYLPEIQKMGELIGSSVSSVFLLLLAIINFFIFLDIYKKFQNSKKSKIYTREELESLLDGKGLITRLLKPIFRLVSKSWHMYVVGFMFGMGFDTASEIALLGISATEATRGLSVWIIMIYPLIFMSGMCLVDTLDGILMLGIYGWAFLKPMKKLFYNMIITLISFFVALLIGGLEALCIISNKLGFSGYFWHFLNTINNNLGNLGYLIIAIFVISWLISFLIYKHYRLLFWNNNN